MLLPFFALFPKRLPPYFVNKIKINSYLIKDILSFCVPVLAQNVLLLVLRVLQQDHLNTES